MRDLAIPFEANLEESIQEVSVGREKKKRWFLALLLSSAGGIFVGLTGLIVSGLNLLNIVERTDKIGSIGTLLIVIAFPLILFSAHVLDKIQEIEKAEKQEKYQRSETNDF